LATAYLAAAQDGAQIVFVDANMRGDVGHALLIANSEESAQAL
jgi:hypothetical protein